jgi:hypothetical protein
MFVITIVPIRSQTAGQYDPSLDENHDGKIDGKDIALPALIFGTAGDPTLNVTVTDSYEEVNFNQVVNTRNPYTFAANTAGYKQVTFTLLGVLPDGSTTTVAYSVYVGFNEGNTLSYFQFDAFQGTAYTLFDYQMAQGILPFINCTSRTYPVTGTQFYITVYCNILGATPITFYVSIFATA